MFNTDQRKTVYSCEIRVPAHNLKNFLEITLPEDKNVNISEDTYLSRQELLLKIKESQDF